MPTRKCLKIGVIYVKDSQFEERQILANSKGSSDYQEFLDGLGIKIDLNRHLGWTAAMKKGQDGKETVYYSN